jgi:hypothetical protein
VADCAVCGAKLPRNARFCAECGRRVDDADATAVEPVPPDETGPVPVHIVQAEPRFFGITPATALFGAGLAALALGIVLVAIGYVLAGSLLIGAAVLLFAAFATAAQRRPDTAMARVSSEALGSLRARAGYAVETLAAHGSARVELFRLRRELAELLAQRAEFARTLGEAVYADDPEATESARARMAELEELISAKEEQMQQTAAGAMERIERAQLQVQPTMIETPEPPTPSPEPFPAPSEPPAPTPIPEPTPEPSEPGGPVVVPEPGPEPSPPAEPQ